MSRRRWFSLSEGVALVVGALSALGLLALAIAGWLP